MTLKVTSNSIEKIGLFMERKKIIAISAGQYDYKKTFDAIKRRIRYLNYGLLGLVTILHDELELDVVMVQGDNASPEEILRRIEKENIDISKDCDCFLLSIPSYYSITWCINFCKLVKERFNKKIIVGGRWVVDNNGEWVRSKLEHVDEIIEGFGEKKLAERFCPEKADLIKDGSLRCFEHLNYELLLDYKLYQPSIEVSRGCGSGCAFCSDRGNKRLPNRSVQSIMRELDYLDKLYGDYSVYLEAPHFHFNKEWCNEFVSEIKKRTKIVPWRCTTRVESVPLDMIEQLAESGLKILDIGLESASHTQLLKMKKTQNPEKYLEKALQILQECSKYGVWVKFNILLFAGETHKTAEETSKWLKTHKSLIKGVAVSSLVHYKGAGELSALLDDGASLPNGCDINNQGYVNLNLSDEIDSADAQNIALNISRLIMTQKDYYDIKSVSYFERGYTYEHFVRDISYCAPENMSFEVVRSENK